ncbi:ABC transporter ATP-binding protein [Plastoroseomonas hellenica]|uniref:ABC transporter ATP-binding protein n=1 Tax=Plastoroseomonas hellenica TaxID=2687306 RepID=UPI0020114021|nr:ABC transporter ATP-binding protein [Plastoroseomonas hellenica]MBR0646358.1 ABC transporter ATP-binding protein [Plastoroseomonas hellenica]
MMEGGQAVEIQALRKRFGAVVALDGVSLTVRPGEFMALLGPSGSGKTTILMAVAGFERADSGHILIGGRAIDRLPPHRRDIGMVFQRYALFPHMSVAENLAYPLRRRGVASPEIARRVEETLSLVKLEGYGGRGIDQLSGGQQQRVAIARALIFRPAVLLMDEPMSALDKKLREHMQMELRLLHRELGATVILVTHDQEEALSMADRVALLHEGRMRQIGTPAELYRNPADAFVAGFIGRNNFLPIADGAPPRVQGFAGPLGAALAEGSAPPVAGHLLAIRPEHLALRAPDAEGEPCRIVEVAFGGARQSVLAEVAGHRVTIEAPATERLWRPGEAASLGFHPRTARIFPPSDQH